jgi:general stress protein 26
LPSPFVNTLGSLTASALGETPPYPSRDILAKASSVPVDRCTGGSHRDDGIARAIAEGVDDRTIALAELARLIDGIPVAMVTTRADDDMLGSRPMLLERLEGGALTFLTHLSSAKIHWVSQDARVNVAFVSTAGDRYVSVSGVAEPTHDPARMRALWKPTYRAWFPAGPDDPDSAILTVRIERIEYWDVPTSRIVRVWCAVKALATGHVVEAGEHHTTDLR